MMNRILPLLILSFALGCTTESVIKEKHPIKNKTLEQNISKKVVQQAITYPIDQKPLFQTERNFKRYPLPDIPLGHYKQLLPSSLKDQRLPSQELLFRLFTTLDTPYGVVAPNFVLEGDTLYIVAFSPFMDSNRITKDYAMIQLDIATTIAFQKLNQRESAFEKMDQILFLTAHGEIWVCGVWKMKHPILSFDYFYKKNHKLTDFFTHLSVQYSTVSLGGLKHQGASIYLG